MDSARLGINSNPMAPSARSTQFRFLPTGKHRVIQCVTRRLHRRRMVIRHKCVGRLVRVWFHSSTIEVW